MKLLPVNGPHLGSKVLESSILFFFLLTFLSKLLFSDGQIQSLFLWSQCNVRIFHSQTSVCIVPKKKHRGTGWRTWVWVWSAGEWTWSWDSGPLLLGGTAQGSAGERWLQLKPGCVHLKPSVPPKCCAWQATHTPGAHLTALPCVCLSFACSPSLSNLLYCTDYSLL